MLLPKIFFVVFKTAGKVFGEVVRKKPVGVCVESPGHRLGNLVVSENKQYSAYRLAEPSSSGSSYCRVHLTITVRGSTRLLCMQALVRTVCNVGVDWR